MTADDVPPPGSPRERDNLFYSYLAGGATTRLLEGFLDLGLTEMLGSDGSLTAQDICQKLALHPHRGWKFLRLLAWIGLLDEEGELRGADDTRYRLSKLSKRFFDPGGAGGYFFRELVNYWRYVAAVPFLDALRGLPLPDAPRWPPDGLAAAEHIETWMRVTADGAVKALIGSGTMEGVRQLLDVGGGDGTVGCLLTKQYPELDVLVFNLPASAYIARRTIAHAGCTEHVKVHEGDFLKDELPAGADCVLFNRVMADWSPDICSMLMQKSRRALAPGGRLVINEPLADRNRDCTTAWQFRYIFYDTFGQATFKTLDMYRQLLDESGFTVLNVRPILDEIYTVIEASPK